MTVLCNYYEPTTNYSETIIISIVSSGLFALIVFLLGLLYDYIKYSSNVATYIRLYTREKVELKGEIAAIAKITYKYKNELTINVETLINEHPDNPSLDYKFPKENVQEWKGIITMDNEEAGKLYWYYIRPEELKNEKRSGFKRALFLHKSNYIKLFGETDRGYFDEMFDRKTYYKIK